MYQKIDDVECIETPEQFFISELDEDNFIVEQLEESQEIELEPQEEDNSHILLLIQKLLLENENQYKGLTTLKNWIIEL